MPVWARGGCTAWMSRFTARELEEALAVGLVVGGSITIPHLRRAWDLWETLESEEAGGDNER